MQTKLLGLCATVQYHPKSEGCCCSASEAYEKACFPAHFQEENVDRYLWRRCCPAEVRASMPGCDGEQQAASSSEAGAASSSSVPAEGKEEEEDQATEVVDVEGDHLNSEDTGDGRGGGDREALTQTVTYSRRGVMPSWVQRLGEADVKQVALYVHSLGGGETE